MIRYILVLGASLLWCVAALADQGERRVVSAVDLIEMPRLSSAKLSPDGRYLLYKKSRTDWDENEIVRRFVLKDLDTGEELKAPNPEDETKSALSAWWSADSQSILFSKHLKKEKTEQVFQYVLETGETKQLTNHGRSISSLIVAPDAHALFFIAPVQQDALTRHQYDEGWRIDGYDTPSNREVWRFDTDARSAQPVLFGDFSVRSISLSDDGRQLLYTKASDHRRQSRYLSELHTLDLASGETSRWTDNQYPENAPKLSPDGSRLAYIADVNDRGEPYYEDKVFVQTQGGPVERLLSDQAMEAIAFEWDATGEGIFILGNTGLSADLYHYTLASGDLRQITKGDHNVSFWTYDRTNNTHIARIESPRSPGELFAMRDEANGFVQVTHEYEDWSAAFRLPKQEAVSWHGRGDVEIEGLLVYPIDYVSGTRYPLVTITHGGPRSSSSYGSWNISRYISVLAGQGYMVLLPNHRGGTGYGDAFVRDMFGGYFQNAHHDVMDGIDAMIDRGLADPDRLVKMGWSAGGHMVNKLITHTDRFKAASSGAGASDWLSMHGESDVRRSRSFVFGGMPWAEDAPLIQYEADSPLRRAWKVTTPTLFFVGENDVRVPPTQSIMMHRGVAATGTPTVLYQAAGEPHNYRKPSHQLFKINTELAWYTQHVSSDTYEPVLPQAALAIDDDEEAEDEQDEAPLPSTLPSVVSPQ